MIFKNGFNYILMNVAPAPVDCCNRPTDVALLY